MKQILLPSILFILYGLFTPGLYAAPLTSPPYILLAQSGQSLNSATQSIKQRTGGRVLSAKTVSIKGRRVHRIKVLLPSGKIQIFSLPAK